MSEVNNGDSATASAVGNITGDALAQHFMQAESKADENVAVEEVASEEPPSQEEVTETPVEAEAQAEVDTPEEKSEEVAEVESDPVLSKEDKALDRMQSRIDKVTAEKYDLSDRLKALESQMMDKQKASDNQGKKLLDLVNEATSFDDLVQHEKEAREAKRFALQNVGRDDVEFQGNTYSDDQIRQILLNSEEVLESIPARREAINNQVENEKVAMETWPEYNDPESSLAKWHSGIESDKETNDILNKLPNKRYILGLIYEGQLSLAAKNAPVPKSETKPVEAVKKQTPVPTSVPGMNSSPTPATKTTSQNLSEERSKLTSSNLSGDSLAQLLDKQYQQNR